MSIDSADVGLNNLPDADTEPRRGPEPVSHGSSIQTVFNDVDIDVRPHVPGVDLDRDATTYDAVLAYWREHVGDRDREPYIISELDPDAHDWLPQGRDGRDMVLVLTSSRWKAGRGQGDDYRSYYEYHLKLREQDADGDLHKPPLALHIEVMPQYTDLNYQDGNTLECPYGEGTRAVCWTTWADDADDVETRLLDGLAAAVDVDKDQLELSRNPDSRRIAKAEAHVRFHVDKKRQVVDVLEQTKQLIAYGGATEIDAEQQRQKEGWLTAVVDADRWDLLGFPETDYNIELKVYQASNWADREPSEPAHHPKIEASFAGVNGDGALPHVDDWTETLDVLRGVVSSHLDWSAVSRDDLVADDYFDGPHVPEHEYQHPTNRRDQLQQRFESVSTEIYREATKAQTQAVYDIMRVVAQQRGASYDQLESLTGLARSTIRYHISRLVEKGVVDKVVGAEALVVYPSIKVLDDAREILREIHPDDTLDDAEERAQDRRERRDQRDHPADVDPDDQDDTSDDAVDGADDGGRSRWAYFDDVPIEPHQLANALERDYLAGTDVRIRTDAADWLG